MEIYRVSFIGHRVVDEHRQVADELDTVLSMLLEKHEYIEFYVGKNGEFDELAASAVRRLKSEWSVFCSLTLVLPYEIANLDLIEKSYDEVIMPNDYKCHYEHSARSVQKGIRQQYVVRSAEQGRLRRYDVFYSERVRRGR